MKISISLFKTAKSLLIQSSTENFQVKSGTCSLNIISLQTVVSTVEA